MKIENYELWDDNVERADINDVDICEITFKHLAKSIYLQKQDVVALAKRFGLVVYERDSAL